MASKFTPPLLDPNSPVWRSKFPRRRQWLYVMRLLWHARFPILFWCLLTFIGPLSITVFPSLLGNVFLASTMKQMVALTILCMLTSTVLCMQFAVIVTLGEFRFASISILREGAMKDPNASPENKRPENANPYWNWDRNLTIPWLISGLVLPLTVAWYSHSEIYSASGDAISEGVYRNLIADDKELNIIHALLGIGLGAFLCCLGLHFLGWLFSLLMPNASERVEIIDPGDQDSYKKQMDLWFFPVPKNVKMVAIPSPDWFRYLIDRMKPFYWPGRGYSPECKQYDGQIKDLLPGHQQLAFFAIALAALYVSIYLSTMGQAVEPKNLFTSQFYLVLILALWSCVLSFVSFLLDYYNIPVTILLVVIGISWQSLFYSDHYFSNLHDTHVVSTCPPLPHHDPEDPSTTQAPSPGQSHVGVAVWSNDCVG